MGHPFPQQTSQLTPPELTTPQWATTPVSLDGWDAGGSDTPTLVTPAPRVPMGSGNAGMAPSNSGVVITWKVGVFGV